MGDVFYPGLVQGGWRELVYEPFRPGIAVHWITRGGEGEPSAAILSYEAGAAAPRHRHAGLETILILEGAQSDESGTYEAGTLVLNPTGSIHSVWTQTGCTVLIQWDRPVVFLEEE